MTKRIINIGVLAHVDAGKTSLTERLLFDNGVISRLWSVDAGSTTTDSSELERERGITIRSAVAGFALGDLQINIVDTPGHPDFIAEVDRALAVLDGAILVISAVEGVQAQTKVLMRSLRTANIPTLIFINKIDRVGARPEALLADIRKKLAPSIVPINHVVDAGEIRARVVMNSLAEEAYRKQMIETLAEQDMEMLTGAVDESRVSEDDIFAALRRLTAECKIFPIFAGSALVWTGSRELAEGIAALLPSHESGSTPWAPQGIVFAIERLPSGEKIACLRLTAGELRERDIVQFTQTDHRGIARQLSGKITDLNIVGDGIGRAGDRPSHESKVLAAGNIAKVRWLAGVRVGARLWSGGEWPAKHFPQPTLESVIRPRQPSQQQKLHAALVSLSDEDPLIQARIVPWGAASVLLYGEVQKEVIAERLIREFDIEVDFSTTSPIHVERPIATGEAEYVIDPIRDNDFWATIGIRICPTKIGEGNRYVRDVIFGLMPAGFYRIVEESIMKTLEQGLFGWRVTDCEVHLTKLDWVNPTTIAADFRCLAPILVMRALQMAQTCVYEPCQSFELEIPDGSLGEILSFLASHDARIQKTERSSGATWVIFGDMPARVVREVSASLSGLTHGEGVLITTVWADRRLRWDVPIRPRTDGNPLNYQEYMRYLTLNGLMR